VQRKDDRQTGTCSENFTEIYSAKKIQQYITVRNHTLHIVVSILAKTQRLLQRIRPVKWIPWISPKTREMYCRIRHESKQETRGKYMPRVISCHFVSSPLTSKLRTKSSPIRVWSGHRYTSPQPSSTRPLTRGQPTRPELAGHSR